MEKKIDAMVEEKLNKILNEARPGGVFSVIALKATLPQRRLRGTAKSFAPLIKGFTFQLCIPTRTLVALGRQAAYEKSRSIDCRLVKKGPPCKVSIVKQFRGSIHPKSNMSRACLFAPAA